MADSKGESRDFLDEEQLREMLLERSNWGRWGEDDQVGALNLITDEKRVAATRLVRTGQVASLGAPLHTDQDDVPVSEIFLVDRGGGTSYYGERLSLSFHGYQVTHVDALSHTTLDGKKWNGRSVDEDHPESDTEWGGIEHWSSGIVTRGVLIDVPYHRGEEFVTPEKPVTGRELEAILSSRGLQLEPGDALLVHSGRSAWNRVNPEWDTLGPSPFDPVAGGQRPGLHASCLRFLRDRDVAVLFWDMMDTSPTENALPWSVHLAIASFGIALVDNTSFEEVVPLARSMNRWEFMVVVNPLRVVGGTGSPVNPIAIF